MTVGGVNIKPLPLDNRSSKRCKGEAFLSRIPPALLLPKIFSVFGFFCRISGILPIQIHPNGSATFQIFSKPIIFTVIYIIIFCGTFTLYLPAYLKQTGNMAHDVANSIADNLFIFGQLLGVVLTTLQIPMISKRIVKLWNLINPVVEFMAKQNQAKVYFECYIRSRVVLCGSLVLVMIYSIVCWRDFSSRLGDLKEQQPANYWLKAVVIVIFFIACSVHLMPCMIFKMFVSLITSSFVGLKEVTKEVQNRQEEGNKSKITQEEVAQIVQMYEKLNVLTKQLGRALGFYLLLECFVMMTSVLMNVFSILGGFVMRDVYSTSLSFVSYSILFCVLTESGETLKSTSKSCLERIRGLVYSGKIEDGNYLLLHKTGTFKLAKISAAGFFSVDRKLTVAMASTFAMYFVVILQMKLNSQIFDENANNNTC